MATGCLALSWAGGQGGYESRPRLAAPTWHSLRALVSLPQASADTSCLSGPVCSALFVQHVVVELGCGARAPRRLCLQPVHSLAFFLERLSLLCPPPELTVTHWVAAAMPSPRQVPGIDTESPRYLPPLQNTGPSYGGRVWVPPGWLAVPLRSHCASPGESPCLVLFAIGCTVLTRELLSEQAKDVG